MPTETQSIRVRSLCCSGDQDSRPMRQCCTVARLRRPAIVTINVPKAAEGIVLTPVVEQQTERVVSSVSEGPSLECQDIVCNSMVIIKTSSSKKSKKQDCMRSPEGQPTLISHHTSAKLPHHIILLRDVLLAAPEPCCPSTPSRGTTHAHHVRPVSALQRFG